MRFSACIEMIFRELPVAERIKNVAAAELPAFEFWSWQNKDLEEILKAKEETGLEVAAFIGSGGGAAVNPAERNGFVKGVADAVAVARRLDCRRLIITVGHEVPGLSRGGQHRSIVEGLSEARKYAEDGGVYLLVEPLNVLDHKGYYLSSSAEGMEIVGEVGSAHVQLLFDIYHQQVTEGNLSANIAACLPKTGHFHVADVPGRHEPGTGEINYRYLFQRIDELGYAGYVGLEYRPLNEPAETLRGVLALVA